MARELRSRKVSETASKNSSDGSEKKLAKAATKGSKRKAPEEASPASTKKQKSTKPATEVKKASKTKTPVAKSATPKTKEKPAVVETGAESTDSETEENDNALVLAAELDSEDDKVVEGADAFKEGQDVGKIPKVSKQSQKEGLTGDEKPGVIYVGRIPHGFYEHEMKQYFSQFGPISRLRLSRNKKTGASKHFAFIEFAEDSTADIVAKTMDNYLLFGHILKCKVVHPEQVHENLFHGANKRFKKVPWNKIAGMKLDKPRTESAWKAKVAKERENRAKKAAKLKEVGYDFEIPDLKDVPPPAVRSDEAAAEVKAVEASEDAVAEPATNGKMVTESKIPKNDGKATKSKASKGVKTRKSKA